jgi:hypothetical protein
MNLQGNEDVQGPSSAACAGCASALNSATGVRVNHVGRGRGDL